MSFRVPIKTKAMSFTDLLTACVIYMFANFIIQLSLYPLTCHSGTDKALFSISTSLANLYVQNVRTTSDATFRAVSCLPRDTPWHKILHNLLHKRAEESIIRYYYFLFGWVATERDPSNEFAPSLPENGALRVLFDEKFMSSVWVIISPEGNKALQKIGHQKDRQSYWSWGNIK